MSRGEPVALLRGAGVRHGDRWALSGIDLEVRAGETLAVVGPSGAGKTTLLTLLNGGVRPSAGSVRVWGRDLGSLRPGGLRRLQARIGTVHQRLDLVGPLRVVHNVNAGRLAEWSLARSVWSLLAPRGRGAAEAALARVGLGGRLDERTDRLSGGEQQRVALARLLLQDPELILADEPIAGLDQVRGREIMGLLRDLTAGGDRTLVVSLHALDLALGHCARVVGLRQGRMLFDLPAASVGQERIAELYRTATVTA